MSANPWDKYQQGAPPPQARRRLPAPMQPRVIVVDGVRFVITEEPWRWPPGNAEQLVPLTPVEVQALVRGTGRLRAPAGVARILHQVKAVLGGTVVEHVGLGGSQVGRGGQAVAPSEPGRPGESPDRPKRSRPKSRQELPDKRLEATRSAPRRAPGTGDPLSSSTKTRRRRQRPSEAGQRSLWGDGGE